MTAEPPGRLLSPAAWLKKPLSLLTTLLTAEISVPPCNPAVLCEYQLGALHLVLILTLTPCSYRRPPQVKGSVLQDRTPTSDAVRK